jgi:hypothetical protein
MSAAIFFFFIVFLLVLVAFVATVVVPFLWREGSWLNRRRERRTSN